MAGQLTKQNDPNVELTSVLLPPPARSAYLAVSYYHRHLYQQSLDICLALLAPEGTDNREILDIALRCCLKLKDEETGEKLARGCRSKVSSSLSFSVQAEAHSRLGFAVDHDDVPRTYFGPSPVDGGTI